MQELIDVADKHGITLTGNIKRTSLFKGEKILTKKQLADWYKRWGFDVWKEGNATVMQRNPRP
jgi:hypothetical protein